MRQTLGDNIFYFLRMQNKVVTMTFSSNYSGQNPKEGTRSDYVLPGQILNLSPLSELILDEHVECGCQCTPGDQCLIIMKNIIANNLIISFRSALQLRRNIR